VYYVEAPNECVHVVFVVIEVETRASGRRDAQPAVERLRAVMASADRDAFLVEHLGHVVRVCDIEME